MALHRWPTDPAGKAPAHTITWAQHQTNLKAAPAKVKPPAKAPPPAEAPVVAPGVLPPPPDPIYDDEIAGLSKARDTTTTNLGQGREAELLGYGYTEDASTGALAFDPNNPFSRASLLKRNYDVSRARTGNQMASGGQLYAGAYQTQQDSINRGQMGAEDSLQKSLTSWLSDNTQRKAQAGLDYEAGAGRAAAGRAARALDSPLYTPTATTPIKTATPPPGKATTVKRPGILSGNTLTAAPGLKGIKVTKKGNRKTYTAQGKGP